MSRTASHGAPELSAHPAGPGGSVLYDRASGQRVAVSHATAHAVIAAQGADDPAAALGEAVAGSEAGAEREAVEREVAELEAAGMLPDEVALRARLAELSRRERSQRQAGAAPGTVGVLTCERPDSLARLLASLEPALAGWPNRPVVVVSDDSRNAVAAARVREVVEASPLSADGGVVLMDRRSRSELAARLAAAAGADLAVVSLALLGDDRTGLPSVGGNRNSLLLRTRGRPVTMLDDDVRFRALAPGGEVGGGRFQSDGDPLERWFAASRDDIGAFLRPAEDNPLARQAELLGRHPAVLVDPAGDGREADLRAASPAWRRRLVRDGERLAVVTLGAAGDLGWDNEHFHLFQQGPTRERLLASPDMLRSAATSREGVQAVVRPTAFRDLGFLMGACLGVDNAGWLPPFPPVGRGEDACFGKLLRRCDPAAAGAMLPRVILHDCPPRPKTLGSPFAFGLNAWLGSLLGMPEPLVPAEPDDRLASLGDWLRDVGSMTETSFRDMVTSQLLGSLGQLTVTLQQQAQGAPPAYVRECERFLEHARQEALRPLDAHCNVEGGIPALRGALGRLGELLRAWPALLDAADRLGLAATSATDAPEGDRP